MPFDQRSVGDQETMRFLELRDLPPVPERCVVINVGTELLSSLAVASAVRYSGMPVLLVNCSPDPANTAFFDVLAAEWGFDVLDLRLDTHGFTLDHIFLTLAAERILLLDSDAEIRDAGAIGRVREDLGFTDIYGAGWIQHDDQLTSAQSGVDFPVTYASRPWIPCAMFRTAYIRWALTAGRSFAERFVVGPQTIQFDTGGELHHWMEAHHYRFAGPSVSEVAGAVLHQHGASRWVMNPQGGNSTPLDAANQQALNRLRSAYGVLMDGLAAAVTASGAEVSSSPHAPSPIQDEFVTRAGGGQAGERSTTKLAGQVVTPSADYTSVVMVVKDGLAATLQTLESVLANTSKTTTQVIVVDNGSTDGTSVALSQIGDALQLVSNAVAKSPADAWQQGLDLARGKRVAFLSNDIRVLEGWFEPLQIEVDANDHLALSPIVVDEEGRRLSSAGFESLLGVCLVASQSALSPDVQVEARVATGSCVSRVKSALTVG